MGVCPSIAENTEQAQSNEQNTVELVSKVLCSVHSTLGLKTRVLDHLKQNANFVFEPVD